MASPSTPLLSDPEIDTRSISTPSDHDEETAPQTFQFRRQLPTLPALPKLNLRISNPFTNVRLPTLHPLSPFTASLHPTLYTRILSLLLSLPAFIILCTLGGPHYAASITFLSFTIFRQLLILLSHYASKIITIRIEITNPTLKSPSKKALEKRIRNTVGIVVDGVIFLGLLVTLAILAREVDACDTHEEYYWRPTRPCLLTRNKVEAAVILGFLAFGNLLVSLPDFGNPAQVTMVVALEEPASGLVKLAVSVLHGEADEEEEAFPTENNV